jgi:hypothetical protein
LPVEVNVKSGAGLFKAAVSPGAYARFTCGEFSFDVFLPQFEKEIAKTRSIGNITLFIFYSSYIRKIV